MAPPVPIRPLLDVVVLSPKLPNAGLHKGHQSPRVDPAWLEIQHDHEVHLKFVCLDARDVERAFEYAQALSWPLERTWVMPEGSDAKALSDRWTGIANAAIALGVNATTRLHVYAWGNERAH